MTTSIILIPVVFSNARKTCNLIQNQKYKNTTELRDFLSKELILKEEDENEDVLIYDLNEFMEEVNDEQLDILTSYFISYVQFE